MSVTLRYIRIPFNLIDDTFYEVLNEDGFKPEIIYSDMNLKPMNKIEYQLIPHKGMCRVFYFYVAAKNKEETDNELLKRGIEESKCCVACRQLKEFGREKYEMNIRRSKQ